MNRDTDATDSTVDLTPMLDVVFILLIFFIVTASFARESGIVIDRPDKNVPESKSDNKSIVFKIDANGQIWFEQRRIDFRSVRALIESNRAKNNIDSVLIVTHKSIATDLYAGLADAARLAKISNVSMTVMND